IAAAPSPHCGSGWRAPTSDTPVAPAFADRASMTSMPNPLSLYVHLPWCVRKCPYCDFNSHRAPQELPVAQTVQALLADLDQALADYPALRERRIDTVFFGGGTPSLFPPAAIGDILAGAHARLAFADDAEITLE